MEPLVIALANQESTGIRSTANMTLTGPVVDPLGLFVGAQEVADVQNLEVFVDSSFLNSKTFDQGSHGSAQYTIDGSNIRIGYQMKTEGGFSYFLMDRAPSDPAEIGVAESLESTWLFAGNEAVDAVGAGVFTNVNVLHGLPRELLSAIWSQPEMIIQFEELEESTSNMMAPTVIDGAVATGQQSLSTYSIILDGQQMGAILTPIVGSVGSIFGERMDTVALLDPATRLIIDPITLTVGDSDHLPYAFETKISLAPSSGDPLSLRIILNIKEYAAGVDVAIPENLKDVSIDQFVNTMLLGISDESREELFTVNNSLPGDLGKGQGGVVSDSEVGSSVELPDDILYKVDVTPLLGQGQVTEMISGGEFVGVSPTSLLARIRILAVSERDAVTGAYNPNTCNQEEGYLAELYTGVGKSLEEGVINCQINDTYTEWVVWAPVDEEEYYCVDSVGFAGLLTEVPEGNVCPIVSVN
ncbi:MAG: hypothetical protein ACI83D_000294 [Planctomycetota bacterium]